MKRAVATAVLAVALGLGAPVALAATDPAPPRPPSAWESAVMDQVNAVRTHPQDYAMVLRKGPRTPATDEAIAVLERQAPLAPLAFNPGLAAAAIGEANDLGPRGLTGHVGLDGSTATQRIQRQGVWSMAYAEAASFGWADAAGVVRQLIIDENVPSRGHRTALLDPGFKFIGVGCGRHAVYSAMCIIDLSGGIIAR